MIKTFLRHKSLVLALGAALALSATARADDESATRRRHHRLKSHKAATAETTTSTDTHAKGRVNGQIPTRDDRNSQEVTGSQVGGANGPEYRVPVGSNIPRKYNRRGYTTDDDRNTFIYDKNDQRLRSTNNVGDSLRNVPGISVRGGR